MSRIIIEMNEPSLFLAPEKIEVLLLTRRRELLEILRWLEYENHIWAT